MMMIRSRRPSRAFAIRCAYDWHGGQTSPLYAFASTGGRVHSEEHRKRLKIEVSELIDHAERHPEEFKTVETRKEPHRLSRLLEYINHAPIEPFK
jgi:hypothetical protein